jgi:hypothetical protein
MCLSENKYFCEATIKMTSISLLLCYFKLKGTFSMCYPIPWEKGSLANLKEDKLHYIMDLKIILGMGGLKLFSIG